MCLLYKESVVIDQAQSFLRQTTAIHITTNVISGQFLIVLAASKMTSAMVRHGYRRRLEQ